MVSTRSTESCSDDTLVRIQGLEKAINEINLRFQKSEDRINLQFQKSEDRIEALSAKFKTFMTEFRASRGSGHPVTDESNTSNPSETFGASSTPPIGTPSPMSLPTFDGSDALAWIARAEQYFLVNRTPPDNR